MTEEQQQVPRGSSAGAGPGVCALVLDWQGVLAGSPDAEEMRALVQRARAHGVRTAIVTNAGAGEWSRDAELGASLADVVVVSGEVGMRKPDPEIYELTLARLGTRAPDTVVVDDSAMNVRGAVRAGLVGIVHVDADRTRDELHALVPDAEWV